MAKVVQHVVRGQVGHWHGGRCLQRHTLWDSNDAFGRAIQMAHVGARSRYRDDRITNLEMVNAFPKRYHGPGCLVSGREGIRRSRVVQAEPLKQIGEVDASICHVNRYLTRAWW